MGGLKAGDTLLVQGASTATGQASVDIGRSLGATVYATSRSEKLDKVRALGAEPLAYGDPKVRELEANVVFEPIGADTFADSVEGLAREGTLVTPGAVGNPMVSFNLWIASRVAFPPKCDSPLTCGRRWVLRSGRGGGGTRSSSGTCRGLRARNLVADPDCDETINACGAAARTRGGIRVCGGDGVGKVSARFSRGWCVRGALSGR